MEAGSRVRLMDVWVGVRDPRQAKKVEHDLVEMLVVSFPRNFVFPEMGYKAL